MKFRLITFLLSILFFSGVNAESKKSSIIEKNKFINDLYEIYVSKLKDKKSFFNKSKTDNSLLRTYIYQPVNFPHYLDYNFHSSETAKTNLLSIRWWNPTEAEKLSMHLSQPTIKEQMKIEKLDRHNSFEKMFNKINFKKAIIGNIRY